MHWPVMFVSKGFVVDATSIGSVEEVMVNVLDLVRGADRLPDLLELSDVYEWDRERLLIGTIK